MTTKGAVITADIVNSSRIDKKTFNKLGDTLKSLMRSARTKFLFYRGDSFQCYVSDPSAAFKLALKLRTAAKGLNSLTEGVIIDLKLSLGIGSIDNPEAKINEATGEAFVISGRGLDDLEIQERNFIIRSEYAALNIALDSISLFTDHLFMGLTLKQAEVLRYLLEDRTQMEIARKLKKTQATVNSHVQALGWNSLVRLLENYKKCILEISDPYEH